MLIEEIMTRDVVTVNTIDNVEKCAKLLLDNNFSGIPVMDTEGELAGIITEGDLIRRASHIKTPDFLAILGGFISLGNPQKFIEEIKRAMSLEVGELMTKEVVTVHPKDDLEKAATLMVEHRISRLPVLDDRENLVGIVSRRDIMKKLYQQ